MTGIANVQPTSGAPCDEALQQSSTNGYGSPLIPGHSTDASSLLTPFIPNRLESMELVMTRAAQRWSKLAGIRSIGPTEASRYSTGPGNQRRCPYDIHHTP